MQHIPFVDLRAQYDSIRAEVRSAMDGVLESTAFILGPEVAAFEKELAAYVGATACVGVSSGTAALRLALLALGVGPGDEVIVPANTYVASALAASQVGARPVLVDVSERYAPSIDAIERAISARTKAIMPVHLYGAAVDVRPIVALARRRGLRVIEDACQAHGARTAVGRAGTMGDAGCFSFYPGKNLGAYGDGGAVVTNSTSVADTVRLQRDFGQRQKYQHLVKGDNCRLDALQAAVLRVKLAHLDDWNARRIRLASAYDEALSSAGIDVPIRRKDGSDVYHLYVIEVPDRDAVRERLAADGIESGVHYPIPIHLQPAYAELGLAAGSFPRTEASAKRLVSLPMYPELPEDCIGRIVRALSRSAVATRVA